jgi:3,4-dihydroxy 2-butanone 4-phosphate synthase/GTP cyclohydrolase II
MQRTLQSTTLRRTACTRLPTRWGAFNALCFARRTPNSRIKVDTGIALILGSMDGDPPLLRIHSQCFTGDVLGSLRCDCGEQLELAMGAIRDEGRGILIYEHQEGRGIGLMAKLRAYVLQDEGLDTIEANHALGFKADYRDFGLPVAILHDLGINRVRLLSNNPQKADALDRSGVEVVRQIPCEGHPNPHSIDYLRTKREQMGHTFTLF